VNVGSILLRAGQFKWVAGLEVDRAPVVGPAFLARQDALAEGVAANLQLDGAARDWLVEEVVGLHSAGEREGGRPGLDTMLLGQGWPG
jgi:hypothetical protein